VANVLILGLGSFGGQIEAARYFARRGATVTATDLKPREKLAHALKELDGEPVALVLGEHRETDVLAADLVVASPAVPPHSPLLALARARGIPVTSEIALTVERLRAPVYAVTGSNGKSTTTTLLGRAIEACGFRTWVGGNIGRPLLGRLDEIEPSDRVVLEVSSFMLEGLGPLGFRPALALVTNLTPNHLDRHGTMEAYAAAKRRVVERQGPEDAAILNRDDPLVRAFAPATRARVLTFGVSPLAPGEAGSFLADGRTIAWRDEGGREVELLPVHALKVPGEHNVRNALAVAAAAAALGFEPAPVARALESFGGIPHRLEVVARRRAVLWINDSKATTPESGAAGILAFPPGLTLIAGGSDKGMDYAPLGRAAAGRVARAFLVGKTREKIASAIAREAGLGSGTETRNATEVVSCDDLAEAVARAAAATPAGQTVLFSPASASFDQFLSYEHRGETFAALVCALPEG